MWVEGWGEVSGRLIVVSGPSGSGKTTVLRRLLEHPPGGLDLRLSISATTRPPRPGEIDGRDYRFLSHEEFHADRDAGLFLEHAVYNGNLYGTPLGPTLDALRSGVRLLLEIEVQGALQVRALAPTALFAFIRAPNFAAMERRLLGRGTEDAPTLQRRLVRARQELAEAHWYDVQIVNDQIDRAADDLARAITAFG
jgi:guanylate kinase